jgi:hypothetical protein
VSRLLVASDLDQTLVYSPRAAARGPDRPSRVVEVLDGQIISLMSDATREGLAEVAEAAVFVPTTTRTRAQYLRIDLPVTSRWAIVASGAVLLVDGEPDPSWSRAVAERLRPDSAPVDALRAVFDGYAGREWLLRVRDADDVFLVAQVEGDLLHAEELASVSGDCDALGWRAVHQGRKLYVLPSGLDKAAAVAEVAARVAEETGSQPEVLAAGDTLLDWGMLAAAARGWVPAGSELDRLGRTAPHVTTTAEAGLAAGDEIVQAWLAATRGPVPPRSAPPRP